MPYDLRITIYMNIKEEMGFLYTEKSTNQTDN